MLEPLFNPKSIAVVGVSLDQSKLASVIYQNILEQGFAGQVFAVNPKYPEINGQKCFAKVSDIPNEVELVVIVIPAELVLEIVKDCALKQVKFAIIISAGFGEVGEAGAVMQREITEFAAAHNLRILGPNCLGVIVPGSKLNASFAAQSPKPGNIAFLSQSGAFNTAILDIAARSGLGFSHFISLGNKSDLSEIDFIREWLVDDQVEVIGLYLEEFKDGKDLLDMVRASSKPVVILHPGESEVAKAAVTSHTGALAGSNRVIKSGLESAGIIQTKSLEELADTLMLLSWAPLPTGPKVAIVTNAGGPGIMVTDMVVAAGLELSKISDEAQAKLSSVLPKTASTHNPIDLVGDALADRYASSLEIVKSAVEVDAILVLLTPQYITQIEDTAKVIIAAAHDSKKPVIPVFMGGKYVMSGIDRFFDAGLAAFSESLNAVSALANVAWYTNYLSQKEKTTPLVLAVEPDGRIDIASFVGAEQKPLPQSVSNQLASKFGIALPAEQLVATVEEAIVFATKNGYPVVLKALAEDVVHKTDVKALFVGISDVAELQKAFMELQQNVTQITGKPNPELLIQRQIMGGEELIIGTQRDGSSTVYQTSGLGFGHLLLVGKGGIHTEVYNDTSAGLVPLSPDRLTAMIDKLVISKILHGFRGNPALAVDKLVETMTNVQRMLLAYPQIVSMDINPVILTTDSCVCVDIKIFVQK